MLGVAELFEKRAERDPVKAHEYHLINIITGESHGGFVSLYGARLDAREAALLAWQIFHGNNRVEHHDPDGIAGGGK